MDHAEHGQHLRRRKPVLAACDLLKVLQALLLYLQELLAPTGVLDDCLVHGVDLQEFCQSLRKVTRPLGHQRRLRAGLGATGGQALSLENCETGTTSVRHGERKTHVAAALSLESCETGTPVAVTAAWQVRPEPNLASEHHPVPHPKAKHALAPQTHAICRHTAEEIPAAPNA